MTLIFQLDGSLKAYLLDQDLPSPQLITLQSLEPVGRTLNLSSRFQAFWEQIWQQLKLNHQDVTKIYLLLGPNAGFTDSRIIFIWIKSWQYFNSTNNYWITKTPSQDTSSLSISTLTQLLNQATLNPDDLTYIQEPRIGTKAINN